MSKQDDAEEAAGRAGELKLRLLVHRLRATSDPEAQSFADELDRIFGADSVESLLEDIQRDSRRPRGRPPDTPLQRLNKLIRAWALSDALYTGELQVSELHPDYEDMAKACVDDRTQADAVAGKQLGVSARTVRRARLEWTEADIAALIESRPWAGEDKTHEWLPRNEDGNSDFAPGSRATTK